MRRALWLIVFAISCHRTSTSQSNQHTETNTVTETTSDERGTQTTTTVVTEAPSKTTTTTEEFAQPEGGDVSAEPEPDSPVRVQVHGLPPATRGVVKRPRHGPLVKRTVTVTETGPTTTETKQEATVQASGEQEVKAQGQSTATAQTATTTKPALSCAFTGWLWGLLLVGAVVGILIFAFKSKSFL